MNILEDIINAIGAGIEAGGKRIGIDEVVKDFFLLLEAAPSADANKHRDLWKDLLGKYRPELWELIQKQTSYTEEQEEQDDPEYDFITESEPAQAMVAAEILYMKVENGAIGGATFTTGEDEMGRYYRFYRKGEDLSVDIALL